MAVDFSWVMVRVCGDGSGVHRVLRVEADRDALADRRDAAGGLVVTRLAQAERRAVVEH
jgi:hypothetical protein